MVRFPKLTDFLLLSIQKSAFFRQKGVPPRVMFSTMRFPCKMPTFRYSYRMLQEWFLPRENIYIEYGTVFLEPPGQLQKWKYSKARYPLPFVHFWRGKADWKKRIQPVYYCQLIAKHPRTWKWVVLCSTRSGNSRLLSCKDIASDVFHIKQKREDKLETWQHNCPEQFLCSSKGFLSHNSKWSGSPNWPISYHFLYIAHLFFRHKGVPPHEWCSPQPIFHVKCQHFVTGLVHTLCGQIHRIWNCISGAPRAVAAGVSGFVLNFWEKYSIYLVWRNILSVWYSI